MEKDSELKLLHVRSIAAVIRDGYQLYTGSFRRLFRSSWIVAIVYALAFAFMMGNLVNNVVPLLTSIRTFGYDVAMTDADVTSTTVLTILSLVLFVLAALLLAAHDVEAFREHQATNVISRPLHWYGRLCAGSFLRLLAVGLWMLLLAVVVVALFWGVLSLVPLLGFVSNIWQSIATVALLLIIATLVMAALVPLAYPVMKSLLGERLSWMPPFKGYALGLRHWGLLTVTLLVVSILTTLLTLVCELPAVVITTANVEAYAGLALGDPLGMPDYIVPMTYAVFVIAGFIQAYVHLSTLFPLYFAYGSIEQQKIERNALTIDNV